MGKSLKLDYQIIIISFLVLLFFFFPVAEMDYQKFISERSKARKPSASKKELIEKNKKFMQHLSHANIFT